MLAHFQQPVERLGGGAAIPPAERVHHVKDDGGLGVGHHGVHVRFRDGSLCVSVGHQFDDFLVEQAQVGTDDGGKLVGGLGFDLTAVLAGALFDPAGQGLCVWRVEAFDVTPLLLLGQFEDGMFCGQGFVFDKDQAGRLGQAGEVIGQSGQILFLRGDPRQQALDDDESSFSQEGDGVAGVAQVGQREGSPVEAGGVQIHGIGRAEPALKVGQRLGTGEFVLAVEHVKGGSRFGHVALQKCVIRCCPEIRVIPQCGRDGRRCRPVPPA